MKEGAVFGRLTLVSRVPGKRNPKWLCLCSCGKEHLVFAGNLRSGRVRSCGCLRQESWELSRSQRTFNKDGYAFVWKPDHPRSHPTTGRVREHIVVMEEFLQRSLLPEEEVHHKNLDRSDNRLENLELWTSSQPSGARVEDQVTWAREILKMYRPQELR